VDWGAGERCRRRLEDELESPHARQVPVATTSWARRGARVVQDDQIDASTRGHLEVGPEPV
jgi:hypothetical protein